MKSDTRLFTETLAIAGASALLLMAPQWACAHDKGAHTGTVGLAEQGKEGSAVAGATRNRYAGQHARPIKSLSEQEVAGLLAGQGAGLAKAAELNGYPGPAHVLELAGPLQLEAPQLSATRQLMTQHKDRASRLGAELVSAERALDALFAQRQADPAAVDAATLQVGVVQARLRAEHLTTHLTQTALLSGEQVRRYNELRGHAGSQPDAAPSINDASPPTTGHRH